MWICFAGMNTSWPHSELWLNVEEETLKISMSGIDDIVACGNHNFLASNSSGHASEETVSTHYGDSEIFKNMDWSMVVMLLNQ